MRLKKKIAPYVFISPFYILFAIFGAFPIIFSLVLSFHRWNGIGAMEWVGLGNYKFVLTDPLFWKSLWNSFVIFVLTTIPQHTIALALAYILHSGVVKFKEFFRSSFFLPYITSTVAVSIVFGMLFGKQYGFLNAGLEFLSGLPVVKMIFDWINLSLPVEWLTNPKLIKPSIALLVTWRFTGWNMIIYYAGLQDISQDLYDAARVDGATWSQRFFKITIPMLKNVIFFAITMSIIGNFKLFAEPMILLQGNLGGAANAGLTTALYLYKTGFGWTEFGTGSAIAYLLCAIIVVLSLINRKFFQEN